MDLEVPPVVHEGEAVLEGSGAEEAQGQHHGHSQLHPGAVWWRNDFPFCNANRLVPGEGVVLSESPRGNGLFLVGGDV